MSAPLPSRGTSIVLSCVLVSLLTSAAGAAPPPSTSKAAPAKIQLQGTVVDDRGRPVEGAVVSGTGVLSPFQVRDPSYREIPLREILTSSRGAFSLELPGNRAGLVVYLQARHKNAFTARPLELEGAALEKPITLKVSPSNARGLRVRVVDEEGKPVAAATAVRYRPRFMPPHRDSIKLTKHSGRATDHQGRFEISPRLDPDGFYQIEVKAEGLPEERTPWKETGTDPILDFGDLTVRRQHELQGQILDRQGKPVAGARVVHASGRGKVKDVTDSEGQFKLTTTFYPPGFLFVEGTGFRFHGQRCDRPEPLKIMLIRREEKAAKGMATLPALPRGERKKLAARVLEPLLRSTQDRGDVLRSGVLGALGQLDPSRMIEELDRKPFQAPWRDSFARLEAIEALLADSPEEAHTLIASMKDTDGRIRANLKQCDALPDSKRAEKVALLDQALLRVRAIESDARRVPKMGWVAGRLWALGEKERATKLLREAEQLARRLPTKGSSSSRGAFAENLGLIDWEAALDLMKDLPSFTQGVHRGNLARKLAANNPAAAERVLDSLLRQGDPSSLAQQEWHRYAPQVCYRMARADLPRARKLADKISDPSTKARTYGLMARALVVIGKPKEARTLLERAFVALQEQVTSGTDHSSYRGSPAAVAGLLLPVAEAIDADLVPEYFWRTLSLAATALPREAGDEQSLGFAVRQLGELALVLARYDREMALGFVEEVRAAPGTGSSRQPYLLAAALADPRRAVALVEELTEGRDKDSARLSVVRLLLAERQGVWKQVHRALSLWFGDDDDLEAHSR